MALGVVELVRFGRNLSVGCSGVFTKNQLGHHFIDDDPTENSTVSELKIFSGG